MGQDHSSKEIIENTVKEFFSKYPQRHFKKGQILVYAGDDPDHIFYLVSGAVRQYDISDRGDEIVVNVFKPVAFFPMSWAINRTPNPYFFETTSDVELHVAPADDTVEFIKSNPEVMFNLLSRLYSGVDGLQRRMAHLMGGSARSRLLFELITECRRFGKLQDDGSTMISTSEIELAQRAGLSRETVNRELSKLKQNGAVYYTNKYISIPKVDTLTEALGDRL
jgi:CRP-like cAMP-binding protein